MCKKLSEIRPRLDNMEFESLERYRRILKMKIDDCWNLLKFHQEESAVFYAKYKGLKTEESMSEARKWMVISGLQACRQSNNKLKAEIMDRNVILSYVERKIGIPV